MHRIDTPTAQVDKFGQGKNGFTNGDPSTGRRATDLNSDMWDAVQEEIANAIEGNDIPLDKSKHNQLYLAIQKAINDPGFLKKANNLSDVEDVAEARGNLKLGSAATKNTGKETGNVISVADYGLANTLPALNSTDLNTIQTFGFYVIQNPINGPAGSSGGTLFLNVATWQSGSGTSGYRVVQEVIGYGQSGSTGNRVWRRTWSGSVWSGWIEFYSEAHKPTAADVGAVASKNGTASMLHVIDELTIADNVKLYIDGGKFLFEVKRNDGTQPRYFSFSPEDGSLRAIRGYFDTDIIIGGEGIRIYKENNGLWFNVSGKYFGFQNDGVFKAGSVFEDNKRVYSPNNPQPPNTEWATVGSYAFAMYGGSGNVNFNGIVSGSNLFPSGAAGSAGGSTLPGSWRCMGIVTTVNDAYRSTLWVRIS